MTVLAALIGATIISFSAILFSLSGADAMTGAFFRVAYATPVLIALWWFRRDQDHRPARLRWLAVGAGVALGLDMIAWHTSIGYIGAGLATLIANTQVVLVALAAWFIFKERPDQRVLLAIPVVLLGVTLVSGLGQEQAFGADPIRGTLLALVAAVFYAFFILVMKFANASRAPTAGPLMEITIGGLATVALIGAFSGAIDFEVTWPAHGWLLALALGPQVAAWLLIGYALPRLPAARTATIVLLQPALTLIWGAWIFGERPSSMQIIGAAVVLVGVGMVVLTRRRPVPMQR